MKLEAAHVPSELSVDDFVMAHGTSRFLKADKVLDMKRKGKTGQTFCA